MKLLMSLPVLLMGLQVSSFAGTIVPGSEIQVRADTPFTVSMWDRNRVYTGYVARDVYGRDGDVVIPRGSQAEFTVRQTGPDQVSLNVEAVNVNGGRYLLNSTGPVFTIPRDGYEDNSYLVKTMMSYLSGAEGSDVDVVARDNSVRVTGGAIVRFRIDQPMRMANPNDSGYHDQEYRYHLDRDQYRDPYSYR